jgi:hypothetical protein
VPYVEGAAYAAVPGANTATMRKQKAALSAAAASAGMGRLNVSNTPAAEDVAQPTVIHADATAVRYCTSLCVGAVDEMRTESVTLAGV